MNLRDEHGFTLMEVLTTITIMLIVLGTTLTVLSQFQSTTKINERQNDAQDTARRATSALARELRNLAGPDPGLPAAVERALSYDLVFQSVNAQGANANARQRVRYCLSTATATGGTRDLIRQEQRWDASTSPAATLPSTSMCPGPVTTGTPDGEWDTSVIVAQNVFNRGRPGGDQAIFRYEAASASCTAAPDSSETCRNEVHTLRTQMHVDVNPGKRPTETVLGTGVFLRNQNRRPVAAFSYVLRGNRDVLLNASESEDPESGKLGYQWYDVAVSTTTPFSSTGPLFQYRFPATGARVVRLVVTDPAGLQSTFEQTIPVI